MNRLLYSCENIILKVDGIGHDLLASPGGEVRHKESMKPSLSRECSWQQALVVTPNTKFKEKLRMAMTVGNKTA